MKNILLTGGGTGGHIHPLLAITERLKEIADVDVVLAYIGPKSPYTAAFTKQGIKTYRITGAKLRRYFALQNFIDVPKFIFSLPEALIKLFFIMPDVVFSKGGPGSFAVVLAARFYRIPVIIHESDSIPSITTKLSARFAKRIGISFETTKSYFPSKKVFLAGNPIRPRLLKGVLEQPLAKRALGFSPNEPVMLVLGGSQGSERINNFVIQNLSVFLKEFQIYHTTGAIHAETVASDAQLALADVSENLRERYKSIGNLNTDEMKHAFSAADIVLSRAGAGAIFEIAAFGKPSILVPLEGSANNHQNMNAYEYAKTGATVVIEENNFTINLVHGLITRLLGNQDEQEKMKQAARGFAKPEATDMIIREILGVV